MILFWRLYSRWVWPDAAGASERIVAPFGKIGAPTRVVPLCNWSDPDHEVSLSDFQKLFTRAPSVGRTTRETAARVRETLDIEVATEFYTVGKVGKEVLVMDEIHKASAQGHASIAKARKHGAALLAMTATPPDWTRS